MGDAKQTVLKLQEEILTILEMGSGAPTIWEVKDRILTAIEAAKEKNDGLTQLYCCMVEACLSKFVGPREELIAQLKTLTETDTRFIFAKEKGVDYPPGTMWIDPDTYGMYYALNDYYAKQWDGKNYKLGKNGDAGNPLLTNLIKLCYEDNQGKPIFKVEENGETCRAMPYADSGNALRDTLFKSFEANRVRIFPGLKIAFAGGEGVAYDITMNLSRQMDKGAFLNFSPDLEDAYLTLKTAGAAAAQGEADYVISSNVINSVNADLTPFIADEVFAASAKLLKKGGKAIHLIEKAGTQEQLNVNLNRTMHKAIGQDLVYSFHREKGPMDFDMDRRKKKAGEEITNIERHSMDGKKDDFATTMLVMHQSSKPLINENTVARTKEKCNHYKGRVDYHHKPVYVANPGADISR